MASLDDRLRKLEESIKPRDSAAERQFQQAVADLDRIAAIIRDSGRAFDDMLAQVKEHAPHLSHYQQQLRVKKELILRDPDGERLWAWFVQGLFPENKPVKSPEDRL
jgi:hypothetical protein